MNFDGLLPIGTVVLLKDASKKLMIFGVGQINTKTNKAYDYIGVLYPEGSMGDGTQFLFNHDDIQEVIFRGYNDKERQDLIDNLNKAAKTIPKV